MTGADYELFLPVDSASADFCGRHTPPSSPSLWWYDRTCKRERGGALAAVCTPTLKSERGKKHQNLNFSLCLGLELRTSVKHVTVPYIPRVFCAANPN
ncbi:hypothetical protein VNO80_25282 [Phaseolus coccineus]|uniref:Uncharacterized protein n=1 Tax=Phaseolus coccineus TaxID=3886 RepID=A0AAN9QNM2_PHACN